jgi:hypothetical protein
MAWGVGVGSGGLVVGLIAGGVFSLLRLWPPKLELSESSAWRIQLKKSSKQSQKEKDSLFLLPQIVIQKYGEIRAFVWPTPISVA